MDMLLPFALILVAFYLLIIRPQRSRARAAAQLQARLAPGVQIITTAGLYGTVTEVEDAAVRLEVSPGVTVRFAKAAVGKILTDDTAAERTDDATEDSVEGDEHGPASVEAPPTGNVETDTDASSRRGSGD